MPRHQHVSLVGTAHKFKGWTPLLVIYNFQQMNRAFLHSFLPYNNNGTLTATQAGRERQTRDLSAVSYGLGHFMFQASKQNSQHGCRVLTSLQDTRYDPQIFTVVQSVHFGLMFSFTITTKCTTPTTKAIYFILYYLCLLYKRCVLTIFWS